MAIDPADYPISVERLFHFAEPADWQAYDQICRAWNRTVRDLTDDRRIAVSRLCKYPVRDGKRVVMHWGALGRNYEIEPVYKESLERLIGALGDVWRKCYDSAILKLRSGPAEIIVTHDGYSGRWQLLQDEQRRRVATVESGLLSFNGNTKAVARFRDREGVPTTQAIYLYGKLNNVEIARWFLAFEWESSPSPYDLASGRVSYEGPAERQLKQAEAALYADLLDQLRQGELLALDRGRPVPMAHWSNASDLASDLLIRSMTERERCGRADTKPVPPNRAESKKSGRPGGTIVYLPFFALLFLNSGSDPKPKYSKVARFLLGDEQLKDADFPLIKADTLAGKFGAFQKWFLEGKETSPCSMKEALDLTKRYVKSTCPAAIAKTERELNLPIYSSYKPINTHDDL